MPIPVKSVDIRRKFEENMINAENIILTGHASLDARTSAGTVMIKVGLRKRTHRPPKRICERIRQDDLYLKSGQIQKKKH